MSQSGTSNARYDGVADFYEATFTPLYGHSDAPPATALRETLGPGLGLCLDLGCGTGLFFDPIASTGRHVVGLDLSSDQLRLAAKRERLLVQADCGHLPLANAVLDVAVSTFTHTDIDDFPGAVAEVARILRPGGRFVYLGVHPCFVGPHVDRRTPAPDGSFTFGAGYTNTDLTFDWPRYGPLRQLVGARHLTLTDLLAAFLSAGLWITGIREVDDGTVLPGSLLVVAQKP